MKKNVYASLIIALSLTVASPTIARSSRPQDEKKQDTLKMDSKPKEDVKSKVDNLKVLESKQAEGFPEKPTDNLVVFPSFSKVVKKALPAVVNVATTQVINTKPNNSDPRAKSGPGNPLEELFRGFLEQGSIEEAPKKVSSLGSGFILKKTDKEFFIVTNYHVISDAKKISVFLHDKSEVKATVHAYDERTDLAVLKIEIKDLSDDNKKIQPLNWGDSESLDIGDWVLAIGNPFGLGSSVTAGIVSAKGRDIITSSKGGRGADYVDDYIQHSAQINMGNSGGCLLDLKGNVIGVNTAILSRSGEHNGVGFASPATVAQKTINQLIEFGRTKRGWLGIRIQHLTAEKAKSLGSDTRGDIIIGVTKDGPAAKAGIKANDIIIGFEGKSISDQNRLTRLVGETEVGKEIEIKVFRKDEGIKSFKVKIEEYENAEKNGKLDSSSVVSSESSESLEFIGLTLSPLTEDEVKQGKKGIRVSKISSNAPDSILESGLFPGDIIEKAANKELKDTKHFKSVIDEEKKINSKGLAALVVKRNSDSIYVFLKLDEIDTAEETKKSVLEHGANSKIPA
ncbi:MAG: serine protease [Candidatus Puniceispirillum sp.]|nr:serine protease [Candidatus Pelagibacter sp.]MBA4283585.1 serine protease [Candidatus Puniceispirillum sp.]